MTLFPTILLPIFSIHLVFILPNTITTFSLARLNALSLVFASSLPSFISSFLVGFTTSLVATLPRLFSIKQQCSSLGKYLHLQLLYVRNNR